MLVREAMSTQVVGITPDASLHHAAEVLATYRVTALPVVDAHDRLVGVLSEADVVRDALVADQRAHMLLVPVREGAGATAVRDVMTPMPVTVGPDDDLAEAVQLMTDVTVKSLPVVERGRVVGMVSRADVVRQLARRDGRVRAEIDDLIRREELDWMVDVVDGVVTLEGPEDEHERRLARALATSVPGVVAVRFAAST